jgi:hypothetical protein
MDIDLLTTYLHATFPRNFKTKHLEISKELIQLTPFLLDSATPVRRAWHVVNGVNYIPLCQQCKQQCCSWNATLKKYSDVCGKTCGYLLGNIFKKRNATCMQKYGYENPRKSEAVKQKIKDTNTVKYGVDNYFKSTEFTVLKQQVLINSPQKTNISQNHISEQSIIQLNDRQWLYTQHIDMQKPIREIADQLGYKDQACIAKRLKALGIPVQHYMTSTAEREIADLCKQIVGDSNVQCNVRPHNNRELDIYIPSRNLAIEYCGLYWHSERTGKGRNYHAGKQQTCSENNIRLITIFEDEWKWHKDLVIEKIKTILGCSQRVAIGARKCKVCTIDSLEARNFMNQYHIQGACRASLYLGLKTQTCELIGVMAMLLTNKHDWSLTRYCTATTVQGGFTKTLKHFMSTNQWNKITTFADLRWSNGDLYKNSGFVLDATLPPDYSYADTNKGTRTHKFNFRHKHLKRMLVDKYKPDASETENMKDTHLTRIWDCGKQRWVMNNPSLQR